MDDLTILGSLSRAVTMNASKELIKFTDGSNYGLTSSGSRLLSSPACWSN